MITENQAQCSVNNRYYQNDKIRRIEYFDLIRQSKRNISRYSGIYYSVEQWKAQELLIYS